MIERVKSAMVGAGAGWVLWLMLALSVVSLAIMLERAWLFWSLRDDVEALMRDLGRFLRSRDLEGARRRLEASPSAEAAVVVAGVVEADLGADAAEEAMAGASALQRLKLERRLAYLGTLGNNAPFIGLLGTVIGIVGAFEELGKAGTPVAGAAATASQLAPQAVMSNIAEALVATAVGLIVAIPAVFAFNTFQRLVKTTLANTDALSHILLAHLRAEGGHGRDIEGVIDGSASKNDRPSKEPQPRGAGRRREEVEDEGGAR
jgi:biopolymer transport protein ExbB